MIKRILVALSGTPYTKVAVQHALELAKQHGAEVTGVTIANMEALSNVGPIPVGAGAAAAELAHYRQAVTQERVEEAIASFEKACREAGMIHCVDREDGELFDELISLWRYHDLTIVGLRGMFEYGIVHNPADQLIRLMQVGIRPIVAVSVKHRPIRRVLIAYSGSMRSAKSMKRFIQMRLWPDPTVKVVCFDRKPDEAQGLLDDAAVYCRAHGFDVESEHVEGSPREGLLAHAAEWNADLIVMGSSARSRMARYVLGDTALAAIRNAEIPLFLTQ